MKKANTKHEFNSALIGMILGDGGMLPTTKLYIRHGGKQLDYVNEKVEYLSKYIQPKSLRQSIDKKGFVYRYAYYNSKKLQYLYKSIYSGVNNKKSLPQNIINRITPISLAFIYMDDGCLSLRGKNTGTIRSREIHLNVQSFTWEEVKRFKDYLLHKYDVDFHLTVDKGHPRLWCNTKNTLKFLSIVAPIVREFPTMHYKLDLKYKVKNISFL